MTGSSIASLLLAACLAGCATPVAPTGGPADKTPPALVSSDPPANTVSFRGDRITLEFSEKVDRSTLQRALSFTPEIAIPPDFDWQGTSVGIALNAPLRDSTTYILTLDNELRDYRGVKLKRPVTVAFSTGPTIDKARIFGRVANPASNTGVPGLDVLAFEQADVRDPTVVGLLFDDNTAPSYRTQTDTDGSFQFSNLPLRPFIVVAVEDRNRNRIPDSTESVALPPRFPQRPDSISVGATGVASAQTWFFGRHDGDPPSLVQYRTLSSRRLELRFSEPVLLDTVAAELWTVVDTASSTVHAVHSVYQPWPSLNRIVIVSDSLPLAAYRVATQTVVSDSAGNAAEINGSDLYFASVARPDTTTTRLVEFGPTTPNIGGLDSMAIVEVALFTRPRLRFNQHPSLAELTSLVSVTSTAGEQLRTSFATSDGSTWDLEIDNVAAGDSVLIEVNGLSRTYTFPRPDDTGSITGTVIGMNGPFVVELYDQSRRELPLEITADSTGRFAAEGLLKSTYLLRVFADTDSSGTWTAGRLYPFRHPESLIWYDEAIEVRKVCESSVDTLRF